MSSAEHVRGWFHEDHAEFEGGLFGKDLINAGSIRIT